MASDVLHELQALLGDRLSTDSAELERHGKDASYHPPAPPDAVAFPIESAEVARIVDICVRHRAPMIPFGVGTSLEGQVTAPRGGVSIDFGRMNRILEVHAEDMDVVVQPGVTRRQLARHLEGGPLFFPVDPGADATFGGMASTRASGTNTVRYGTMRDNVLALQVALPDGRLVRTGSRARKSAAGYDLTHLLIGAEGTLGMITELTLRLHAAPRAISSAVCAFPGLEQAVDTVIRTIRSGVPVARIELLDEVMIDAVNRHSDLDHTVAPTLFFEYHGSEAGVEQQAQAVQAIAREFGGNDFRWAADPDERRRLWRARHDAYHAARALRPEAVALSTDACVPISNLATCILETKQDLAGASIPAPLVGHVGDGNFHLIMLVDPADPGELKQAREIHDRLVARALRLNGTCTGEHGIGIGKVEFLRAEHGEAVDVMRAIKQTLDPHDLMNPGKMF